MASKPVVVEKAEDEPFETSSYKGVIGTFEKVGKREKGAAAETYKSKQIKEFINVNDPAELLAAALEFLDNNFDYLKDAVLNGINQKRRFVDAPGADPFEQVLKFMAKKGISMEALVEKATK